MPEDRTVLDHLLEGRNALAAEVERLTAAINDLDSVLGRIGSIGGATTPMSALLSVPSAASAASAAPPQSTSASTSALTTSSFTRNRTVENVNPSAEVETGSTGSARRRPARKSARKSTSRARGGAGEAPTSIRVHVLEMLGAENREFGLAEIIDHVHAAGIQAHDDAVRSITIKLMKDGRVERVGRGQYRLARRGSLRASAATAPRVDQSAPAENDLAAAQDDISAAAQDDPGAAAQDDPGAAAQDDPGATAQDEWLPIDGLNEQLAARPDVATDRIDEDTQAMADIPAPDHAALADTTSPELSLDDTHDDAIDYGLQILSEPEQSGEADGQDDAPTEPSSNQPWESDYSPPLNLGQPWQQT